MSAEKIAKYVKIIAHGVAKDTPVAKGNLIVGTVISITGQTCSVDYNNTLFEGVRLMAIEDVSQNVFLVTPVIGSKVLLASMDGTMANLVVIKMQEVQKFFIKQADFEFELNTQTKKCELKNADTSIGALLRGLINIVKTLKVYTPAGPSGIPLPDSITALNTLLINVNKLFK
jgi:hypothetical protein